MCVCVCVCMYIWGFTVCIMQHLGRSVYPAFDLTTLFEVILFSFMAQAVSIFLTYMCNEVAGIF